jgi:hypothetical protein
MGCRARTILLMRSIHFRVSDGMFCREAAIARAVLWEARRGYNWTDPEVWDEIMDQIRQIETHDARLRAELARQRRPEKNRPPDRAHS